MSSLIILFSNKHQQTVKDSRKRRVKQGREIPKLRISKKDKTND